MIGVSNGLCDTTDLRPRLHEIDNATALRHYEEGLCNRSRLLAEGG